MAFFSQYPMVLSFSVAALGAMGCAQARPARMQDTAQEHLQHMRFGRNEVATEAVASTYRQLFLERHKEWGGEIRIADVDMTGMKLEGDDAEVGIKVSWYQPAEGDLHMTMIKQRWHDTKGTWRLVSEEHSGGSPGLFGEKITPAGADGASHANAKRKPAQFPTYVIGQTKEEPTGGD